MARSLARASACGDGAVGCEGDTIDVVASMLRRCKASLCCCELTLNAWH